MSIARTTVLKIAANGGKVYTYSMPAGPTTPAWTNYYAKKEVRDREYARWPELAALATIGEVPAASLDPSVEFWP